MAKSKCTVTKKSAAPKGAAPVKAGPNDPVIEFDVLDNENRTVTVRGKTKGGNVVDITDVATMSLVSDDPSIIAVDPPVSGMTAGLKAVGPTGTTNVQLDVTWNDGSIGPFGFNLPGTVKLGPANAVVVELGTPTSN